MSRDSLSVRLGRYYQRIPPRYLRWLEAPLQFKIRDCSSPPTIIVIAPPRSGSTLTYQLLIHSIEGFYLSNLWNLLFATPVIGGAISQLICPNHKSDFRSHLGFIPGICGPAEGLKFWSYWFNMHLVDNQFKPDPSRANRVVNGLGYISEVTDKPFITGYLGHLFGIDHLREYFPRSIFVVLRRDMLSNAYSMYKNQRQLGVEWFSLVPHECIGKNYSNKYEQAVEQLHYIYKRVQEQAYKKDVFNASYEDICADPGQFIHNLISFALDQGIRIRRRNTELPAKFKARIISPEFDEDSMRLSSLINKLELPQI